MANPIKIRAHPKKVRQTAKEVAITKYEESITQICADIQLNDITFNVSPVLANPKEYIYWKYVTNFLTKFFTKSGCKAVTKYTDSEAGRLYYVYLSKEVLE